MINEEEEEAENDQGGCGWGRALGGEVQRGVKLVSERGWKMLSGKPHGIQPPDGASQGGGRGGSEVGDLAGGGQVGLAAVISSLHTFPLPFLNKD